MFLLIDPGETGSVIITTHDGKKEMVYTLPGKNSDMLRAVIEVLSREKKNSSDVQGIAVIVGSGGFTSTRLATTLANTWNYALHIPIVGITREEKERWVQKVLNAPKDQYVSATYSGEPNIGRKKK